MNLHYLTIGGLLVATAANASTIRVPLDYPSILAAMDASVSGDTVLVAPGTYMDWESRLVDGPVPWTSCVFMKDGVVLRSEQGPEGTVIDMSAGGGPQPAVVNALNLTNDLTAVEGFTIRSSIAGHRGIYLFGKLIVVDCLFPGLDVRPSDGAGIAANGDIIVRNCRFWDCLGNGGGAFAHGNGRIEMYDSIVSNCGSIGVKLAGSGEPPLESAHFENCEFSNCWNTSAGAGGLGISSYWGGVTIRGCRFIENVDNFSGGGGLGIGGLNPVKVIENCVFVRNETVGPNGVGGAISIQGPAQLRGNTFWENGAYTIVGGAAIAFSGNSNGIEMERNIIASCKGGGAIYAYNVGMISSCNVFWENEGGLGMYFEPGPTDRIIDPLFCDAEKEDFTLRSDSPCLPNNSGGCGLIGALEQGCGTISVDRKSWGSIKGAYRLPEENKP